MADDKSVLRARDADTGRNVFGKFKDFVISYNRSAFAERKGITVAEARRRYAVAKRHAFSLQRHITIARKSHAVIFHEVAAHIQDHIIIGRRQRHGRNRSFNRLPVDCISARLRSCEVERGNKILQVCCKVGAFRDLHFVIADKDGAAVDNKITLQVAERVSYFKFAGARRVFEAVRRAEIQISVAVLCLHRNINRITAERARACKRSSRVKNNFARVVCHRTLQT